MRGIQIYLETKEHNIPKHELAKAVLTGKVIISMYTLREKISNRQPNLKHQEIRKRATQLKVRKKEEIAKVKAEINEIGSMNTTEKVNKNKILKKDKLTKLYYTNKRKEDSKLNKK